MIAVEIREKRVGDEPAIHAVTKAAFTGHPHSEGMEPAIVDALRAAGDLALSLVAEVDGAIVGHVAYSPAILSTGETGWLTLGPISVRPEQQGRGIGRTLIEISAEYLRRGGADGIMLIGDPVFYARFGFVRDTPLHISGPLADHFQVLPFTEAIPTASVTFAPAFGLTRLRDL